MRLHVISLPHTQTTAEHATCAYTQKVRKFGKMMTDAGHDVVVYSGEENDAVCAEHVPLVTEQERRGWFGAHDLDAIHPITWDPSDEHWRVMNGRAIAEVATRLESERDLLLLTSGGCQILVSTGLPEVTACEPFVGYEGIATKHRAFESHAWMHHVYGLRQERLGVFFDTVIPNYFDPAEFPAVRAAKGAGDYLLFMGRVIHNKGPHIAAQIADAVGMELVVAGPGVESHDEHLIVGDGVEVRGDRLRYVGAVGIAERAELLAGARAVIVPTLYLEPFGGVAVEAMLAGAPVVATNWGAFAETVEHGVTGHLFRTLQEGIDAVELGDGLEPAAVRARALERFSLEAVAPMFDEWFGQLDSLWEEGWATRRDAPGDFLAVGAGAGGDSGAL